MRAAACGATSPEYRSVLAAFRPERYGFRACGAGWAKEFAGLGTVIIAPLSWQHAHVPSYRRDGADRVPTDVLNLLVRLQEQTWGMPPEDVVPANLLAVLADTGGSVLAAHQSSKGLNGDGWFGFAIAVGSRSGVLVSHMLGVREDLRGSLDLGWYLKLVQGYEALRAGHTAATWTFDPMRGANARLNLEKLGAVATEFTIDKYGALRSALYGDVPSDRLTARWNLTAPATADRISRVYDRQFRGLELDDVAGIPEVTQRSLPELVAARPPTLRYRIPGDIDRLMQTDPGAAISWRQELRKVFSRLLTTKSAWTDEAPAGPSGARVREQPGHYVITGFATGRGPAGQRVSYYVLSTCERPT